MVGEPTHMKRAVLLVLITVLRAAPVQAQVAQSDPLLDRLAGATPP